MSTIYLDPGYDAESSYPLLESLLLLFKKVYVYAPNATAMSRVLDTDPTSISPGTFLAYAKDGLLAPIAGERYWNREKRKERIERSSLVGKEVHAL